jgi:hypothetical protein
MRVDLHRAAAESQLELRAGTLRFTPQQVEAMRREVGRRAQCKALLQTSEALSTVIDVSTLTLLKVAFWRPNT